MTARVTLLRPAKLETILRIFPLIIETRYHASVLPNRRWFGNIVLVESRRCRGSIFHRNDCFRICFWSLAQSGGGPRRLRLIFGLGRSLQREVTKIGNPMKFAHAWRRGYSGTNYSKLRSPICAHECTDSRAMLAITCLSVNEKIRTRGKRNGKQWKG